MKNLNKYLIITITAVFMISCSNKQEKQQEEKASKAETIEKATQKDKSTSKDTVNIVIQANDQMKFSMDKIKVKSGQVVKLTLQHVGEMPVESMGHNWVLLTQETKIMQFAQKASNAKDNGYIPEQESSKVIANTKMLGGGEEDTITFKAPAKGAYDYICSFPGHAMMMQGEFIVE